MSIKGAGKALMAFKLDPKSELSNDLYNKMRNGCDNPFNALIEECEGNAKRIQTKYYNHRERRLAQQKAKLLAPDFPGMEIDDVLNKLSDPAIYPGYCDPRHCLVLWARPTQSVKDLIRQIQEELRLLASSIWLMPQDKLHMTVLEVTHSRTAEEISELVERLAPIRTDLADYTYNHRTTLVKPLLGFDAQGLALSFVPAAGEISRGSGVGSDGNDYTYHHLRRDLHEMVTKAGMSVGSRYVVPSAHITVARFTTGNDFTEAQSDIGATDPAKVKNWISKIEGLNEWLKSKYWSGAEHVPVATGGGWYVGKENGLDFRRGTLWYGGGSTIKLGKGF